MRFDTNSHPYYCGIDLHSRILYVYIIDDKDNILVHKKIGASPDALMALLEPYLGNIIVGVECIHCWYWVADWCEDNTRDGRHAISVMRTNFLNGIAKVNR